MLPFRLTISTPLCKEMEAALKAAQRRGDIRLVKRLLAIFADDDNLSLTNCVVAHNKGTSSGGGISSVTSWSGSGPARRTTGAFGAGGSASATRTSMESTSLPAKGRRTL